MSETLELTLSLKLNGKELQNFPIHKRITVDEVQALLPSSKADDGDLTTFSAIAVGDVDSVTVFYFEAIDGAVGVRIEGSETGSTALRLASGGLVLVFGATGITDTNLTDNQNTGGVVNRRILAGGT